MTQEKPSRAVLARSFSAAFRASLPVMTGYLFLGGAYGVLMNNIGYGPGWTMLMAVIVFGGSIQFVGTGLLAAGFQPLYAFLISLMINARHLFYGFSMLERYAGTGWKKFPLVFCLTDETFSLVCSDSTPEGADPTWYRLFISVLDYAYWIVGGGLGNVAGSLLGFNSKGVEFVMTSLFMVIVVHQWKAGANHLPAIVGAVASALCLVAFGPDYFIIPAMLAIVALLMCFRGRIESPALAEELAAEEDPLP